MGRILKRKRCILITDLEIFDRGVYSYLSDLSSKIVYAPTSRAVKTITKDSKYADAIPYNMISFYRDPNLELDADRDQFSAAVFGDRTRLRLMDDGSREIQYVHNFPVNLTYQVDIWATKATYVQETAISLMTKLRCNNCILLADMNPEGEEARFHFTNITWVDNSDLEVEDEKGRLYRHTITFTIDARIKLSRTVPTTEFCVVPVDIYE